MLDHRKARVLSKCGESAGGAWSLELNDRLRWQSIQVIRKSSVIFSSLKFFSTVCQDRYRLLHLMPESPLSEYTRLNCIPAVGLDVALEDFLLHEGETGALDAHHKLIG